MEDKFENNGSSSSNYSQPGYGQGGYDQNSYGQANYNQNSYGQTDYNQSNYSQAGYGQNAYPQGSDSQSAYPQGNYNQAAYGQGDYSQGNYGQGNYSQGAYDQGNYGQGNYSQGAYDQGNYGQSGYNQGNTAQNIYGQGNYGQNGYGSGGYVKHPGFSRPVQTRGTEAVRDCGKGFPFLFGTICYTLAFILSIVGLLTSVEDNLAFYEYWGMESLYGFQFVGTVIGLIPLILTVIGMWLFFSSCVGKREVPSTVGITLNRGAIITVIVLFSIVLALYAIGAGIILYALVVAGASADSLFASSGIRTNFTAGVGVVAAILAVVLAILILVLIYYVKMLKTTRVICRVLRTGKVRENISMYHIVFNFLAMLVNVPILMMNLRNAPYLASAVPSVIQSILTLISYIAVTVSLIMLRSRLQALMSENPMYR